MPEKPLAEILLPFIKMELVWLNKRTSHEKENGDSEAGNISMPAIANTFV